MCRATIPEVDDPLIIGVRPSCEEAYQVRPGQFLPRGTATDVFISAVGSCMLGAFAREEPGGLRYVERIHVQLHTHFDTAE